MRKALSTVAFVAGIMMLPLAASAHHGWAAFDQEQTVNLQGTVTVFHFTNPHCVVEFEVKDDKGKVENWQGEMTSLNRLSRKGWTAATLEAGDEITVTGHRARSGVPVMRVMKISAKGQELKVDLGN